jgi:Golgi apparatus protein 1
VVCLPGFADDGSKCAAVCSPGCVHGNCTAPNVCTCDVGWRGNDCNKSVCLPGCKSGRCDRPFECICEDGYDGMYCDIREELLFI